MCTFHSVAVANELRIVVFVLVINKLEIRVKRRKVRTGDKFYFDQLLFFHSSTLNIRRLLLEYCTYM